MSIKVLYLPKTNFWLRPWLVRDVLCLWFLDKHKSSFHDIWHTCWASVSSVTIKVKVNGQGHLFRA